MHLLAFYFVLLFAKPVPPPRVLPPEVPQFFNGYPDDVLAYRLYLHEGDNILVQDNYVSLRDGRPRWRWGTASLSKIELESGRWAEPYYQGRAR
jgi:hypothetical protein